MFHFRLKALLERKKIKQAEFALMMDVEPIRVSEWVNNKVTPRGKTIEKIMKVLNATPEDLFGGKPANAEWPCISIIGEVKAGVPAEAIENPYGYFVIPPEAKNKMDFGLVIDGDSMINVGFEPGDYIFVKRQPVAENRQIVVARVNGEAAVKRFFNENGTYSLVSENPLYGPRFIKDTDQFEIIGIVTGLWKKEIK